MEGIQAFIKFMGCCIVALLIAVVILAVIAFRGGVVTP